MKVNQVISQRPIFSFKVKFPDEHNNNTRGGGLADKFRMLINRLN